MDDGAAAAVGAARMRWTAEQRRALGQRVLEHRRERGFQKRMAETLGVSTRWLRELARREDGGEPVRPPGRPRKTEAERMWVRERVDRELTLQGVGAGERPIREVLQAEAEKEGRRVSLMLVREEMAKEKCRRRTRTREELEAVRESHDVLARDALWSHDATHLGRLSDDSEIAAEVIEDRGTLATAGLSVGGPITAVASVALLEQTATERGGWPLALQEDNAKIHDAVDREAAAHRVVVLRSRVHTPTDNPAVEHRNHELKEETGLGKGVVLAHPAQAAVRMDAARHRLDHGRPRATRGWMTAAELDAALPRADTLVDRETFYAATTAAMDEAARGVADRDERCLARQGAFWTTMRAFGLATTHVGPRQRVRAAPTPRNATRDRVQ